MLCTVDDVSHVRVAGTALLHVSMKYLLLFFPTRVSIEANSPTFLLIPSSRETGLIRRLLRWGAAPPILEGILPLSCFSRGDAAESGHPL